MNRFCAVCLHEHVVLASVDLGTESLYNLIGLILRLSNVSKSLLTHALVQVHLLVPSHLVGVRGHLMILQPLLPRVFKIAVQTPLLT